MNYKRRELSILTAVKYKSEKSFKSDYSAIPRPCHNLAFMLSGKVKVESDGKTFTVNSGEIFFIPKNTTYRAFFEAGECGVLYHTVHFDFYPDSDPFSEKTARVCKINTDKFDFLYGRMETLAEKQYDTNCEYFSALSAFYDILAETVRSAEIEEKETAFSSVLPAIRKIESDCAEKLTVDMLAALCFLSPSRFYFLFRKQTGKSPIAYKNDILVRKASRILVIDKKTSVEKISEELGFESAVYFRRLFKKATGLTPTEFRERSPSPV